MKKAIFFHAGLPVCLSAKQEILNLIPDDRIEVIHLGEEKGKIAEAERAGVQSIPALLTPNGHVLHINFGTRIADLK
ncbi:thioredoxin family protein [Dyadobacter sp. 676]|uniref:Thioredoxin family protein n=1 Tax=Dyadobacter sp. 676 TaxID=3088362 RepID=A0AAU8FGY7_9BACT